MDGSWFSGWFRDWWFHSDVTCRPMTNVLFKWRLNTDSVNWTWCNSAQFDLTTFYQPFCNRFLSSIFVFSSTGNNFRRLPYIEELLHFVHGVLNHSNIAADDCIFSNAHFVWMMMTGLYTFFGLRLLYIAWMSDAHSTPQKELEEVSNV